jgi:hypothetical protein
MKTRILSTAAIVVLLAGCATVQKDHSKLYAAQPRSILVIPVMNKSVNVEAPDYFLSTVPLPLAERGYYVFPVNLVKRILEDDGLADAGLVHSADPTRLASLFGADAVLYVSIERWDAKYVVISTSVTVSLSYVLKDGKTGEVLWEDAEVMKYSSGDGGGGLIGAIVNAAVTKAAPNYMPLAHQANAKALRYPGPGFPAGPYRPEYGQDWAPAEGLAKRAPAAAPAASEAPAATPAANPGATPAPTPTTTNAATSSKTTRSTRKPSTKTTTSTKTPAATTTQTTTTPQR